MAYQVATIKKTTVVTSAKRAVGWADGYCNEIKKHKGKEVEGGILIGQTYFTSRPRGTLSAHGFGKKEVARLNRTRSLADNEATLEFIQEHCRKQKLKGRKIMGLRLILSMDPVKVTQLLMDQVDIDRLLVRVAEDTFSTIARKFYPGDDSPANRWLEALFNKTGVVKLSTAQAQNLAASHKAWMRNLHVAGDAAFRIAFRLEAPALQKQPWQLP